MNNDNEQAKPLTPMQRVKQVYEDAYAHKNDDGTWEIRRTKTDTNMLLFDNVLGKNGSANGAWKNAAERMDSEQRNYEADNANGSITLVDDGVNLTIVEEPPTTKLREVAPGFTISGMSDDEANHISDRLAMQQRVDAKQFIVNAGLTYHQPKEVAPGKWQLELFKNGDPEIRITRETEQECWEAAKDAITGHELARRRMQQMDAAKHEAETAPLPDINGSVTFDDKLYKDGSSSIAHSQAAAERAMRRKHGASKLMSDSARYERGGTLTRQQERKQLRDSDKMGIARSYQRAGVKLYGKHENWNR